MTLESDFGFKPVTFANNHLCVCGFGMLFDSTPRGTIYHLDMATRRNLDFQCGGCKGWVKDVDSAIGYRDGTPKGYMPLSLFKEFLQ
jgi:hypothetical protein